MQRKVLGKPSVSLRVPVCDHGRELQRARPHVFIAVARVIFQAGIEGDSRSGFTACVSRLSGI